MHGGIAPGNIIDQLNEFQRPVPKDKEKLVNDLLWSDPGNDITGFELSKRGGGTCSEQIQLRASYVLLAWK